MPRVRRQAKWDSLEEAPETLQDALDYIRDADPVENPYTDGQNLALYALNSEEDREQIHVGVLEGDEDRKELGLEPVKADFFVYRDDEAVLIDVNRRMDFEERAEDQDNSYDVDVRELPDEVYEEIHTAAKDSGFWELE